ncbi:hypothetical protein BCF44_13622 [Kutzneria buriramensis]|uniref:Uncharacterized protein n=1 Tax=Kutzneria buriramensis TaxID=1045776 RepID=A0A3E0G5T4_9PSEU|nr:hypothetical protein BCF44_13622 [Kutzneria buriramensis]
MHHTNVNLPGPAAGGELVGEDQALVARASGGGSR